jgi:hypothetical protein
MYMIQPDLAALQTGHYVEESNLFTTVDLLKFQGQILFVYRVARGGYDQEPEDKSHHA